MSLFISSVVLKIDGDCNITAIPIMQKEVVLQYSHMVTPVSSSQLTVHDSRVVHDIPLFHVAPSCKTSRVGFRCAIAQFLLYFHTVHIFCLFFALFFFSFPFF